MGQNIDDMSIDQIQDYLAKRQQSQNQTQSQSQNETQGQSQYNGGIQNPADILFNTYTGGSKRGAKWKNYIDQNVTNPEAKQYMLNEIHKLLSANPNMSPDALKYRLRAIQANTMKNYPNGVSSNFDISGTGWGMWDNNMAKDLLSLYNSGEMSKYKGQTANTQKPVTNAQKPVRAQATTGQKISPKVKLQQNEADAFDRIKRSKASDADLDMFTKYTNEQLKAYGFGPVSIKAIEGRRNTSASRRNTSASRFNDERDAVARVQQGKATDADKKLLHGYSEASLKNMGLTSDQISGINPQPYTHQLPGAWDRADTHVFEGEGDNGQGRKLAYKQAGKAHFNIPDQEERKAL